MSETYGKEGERTSIEQEFDELWKPVFNAHKHYRQHIQTSKLQYPSIKRVDELPKISFISDIEPNLEEVIDQDIFEKYVDGETFVGAVANHIKAISLKKNIENAVGNVNNFFGFDPTQEGALDQAFTGVGPALYLQAIPTNGIYGYSHRRTARLIGFSADGASAVVKRFGDIQQHLEEIGYWHFSYSEIPNYKPSIDPGDYNVVAEAKTLNSGSFS